MNISDRIQALRREKGITQEALAEALGVSRQAVSKWESEQSLPDLERVTAMCDYFGVTADYLLRGIEPAPQKRGLNVGARSVAIIATAIDFCVLVAGAVWWYGWKSVWALALALMGHALGVTLWLVCCGGRERWFWRANIWLIAAAPAYALYDLGVRFIPGGDAAFFAVPALYIAVCVVVSAKQK